MINKDIERVLVDEEAIDLHCRRLAKLIDEDYKGKEVIFVGLLKGCVPFFVNLTKYVHVEHTIEFMDVSSYVGVESTNKVKIVYDLSIDINGKDLIIVEDIVDTGQTLELVCALLHSRGAGSIKVVTLLDKPEGRKVEFVPDYIGQEIPNVFVVGFGLDYDEKYRNLPFIGILKKEIYSKMEDC